MKKILFFVVSLFASVSNPIANADQQDVLKLPPERGKVVFSCNEKSPYQLYVIGMGHRETLTKENGSDTVKSQIEAYRIGEWLVRETGLELILPEGFFLNEDADGKEAFKSTVGSVALDNTKTLEEKLGRDDAYINAEMLLMVIYNMRSQQVEDTELYNAAREKVSQLKRNRHKEFEAMYVKADLDYLRERRTAAMLQKAPEVVEAEYGAGRIKSKKAILTIGISHLPGLIKYLQQGRIEIVSPAFTPYTDYLSGVKLLEQNFGVTIIIPRSLMDVKELVILTRAAQD